ncbi:TetR family transcriptional regulator [Streptosporangium sp. NPDC051023]|uniref:TetR/AcrR family transcriptional regulator n=1 Tax=Streptosporangium sp. NPDC051023 TaxID=3155410 RepID=UPI00344B58F3
MPRPTLRARKQQRARDEIVTAAYELFAERGYADVTVADIAERAEVGRTTFFRYFGDKQEVVFADEQEWLDDIGRRQRRLHPDGPPSLPEALRLLRETTLAICAQVTQDAERYVQRERLIADNPELGDRAARKRRRLAETLGEILREQNASAQTATLAPHVALACYNAGHEIAAGDPSALGPHVAAAFDLLGIGSLSPEESQQNDEGRRTASRGTAAPAPRGEPEEPV